MAFGIRVQVPIPFPLEKEGKIRGDDRARREAGSEFLFLLSRFSLDSRGGRRWGLRRRRSHLCGTMCGESSNTRGQILEGRLQGGYGWW